VGAAAVQGARWLSIVLIGTGTTGAAGMVGLAQLAALTGGLLLMAGFFSMEWTTTRWNREALRSWRGATFRGYELLIPRLFRWIDVAYLGVGLMVGALLPTGPLILVAGCAGLIGLIAMRRPAAR
jgi:hypothetical protein